MSLNTFGHLFRVTTWGESHGPALGATVDGCPPGVPVTAEAIQHWLDRRKPGQSRFTTQRREADEVEILSGVFEGISTGTPIQLMIRNTDQRSKDYSEIARKFRPGHADITYWTKYGIRDYRGGGRSSARETAARVAASGIARAALAELCPGLTVRGALVQMGPHRIDRAAWAWDRDLFLRFVDMRQPRPKNTRLFSLSTPEINEINGLSDMSETGTSERLSGGDMLIRALQDEGVEYIFGYPGGAALHIYDAIFRQQAVEHVLVRHEQAATHMADGYARATGRAGVVLVTSGPGATNAITGIATAYMDSIPMVVISGQVPSNQIGTDAFQETDMVGVSRPVVKHSFMVRNAEEIPQIVKKAFHIAVTGRPGPVVIDVPKDVTDPNQEFDYAYPDSVRMRSYSPGYKGNNRQIRKAVKLLLEAKRPVIYSGGGVIQGNASDALTNIARIVRAPVTNTLMGLGAFPGDDEQFLGMLGMHGTYEANMAMHHADLIFAVGARFDDRVTNDPGKFCPEATFVHIDVDPASISKIIPADVPIVGHVESVLEEVGRLITDQLAERPELLDNAAAAQWHGQIAQWRNEHGLNHAMQGAGDAMILPQQAVQELYRATQGDAFVSSDVGQHQMFAAQYYRFNKPRRWINSGGLGTMGFGLPAAMGVQFAFPEAVVACVTGEGSFMMNMQELSTCLQYGLPIKIINLNNQALGMVKQWQDMQYGGRHSSSTYSESLPDFQKLAETFGHVGIKVTRYDELRDAMEEVFSERLRSRLVLLDVWVDPNEHVYPMAIKGGAMSDMVLGKGVTSTS